MKTKSFFVTFLALAFLAPLAFLSPAHARDPFKSCQYFISIPDGPPHTDFVWKPSGAHRSQAVMVLPGRFKGYLSGTGTTVVRSVTLYRATDNQKIGTMPMKSTGVVGNSSLDCVPGGECLGRPAFAHPTLSGPALARRYGRIRVRIVTNIQNHVHCTPVFNPKNRQD